MANTTRRQLLLAASATGLAACAGPLIGLRSAYAQSALPTVSALFCGMTDDGGFMQAGYQGLMLAQNKLGIQTHYLDKIPNETKAQQAALRKLAQGTPQLIVAHGGQNTEAVTIVSKEFPNILFVVTQGVVIGPNLSSYDVMQEESAWLAGAYAAMMTKTGVVAHQSGIRVPPGLRGRAAYAAGVHATDPKVKLLTNFSGNQDDIALSKRVTEAQAKAGADIIFTMLNSGRTGTTEACRTLGIKEIGNVADWVAREPDVFIASAYADVGIGVFEACKDLTDKTFKAGQIFQVGLKNPDAVRLIMAVDTPDKVRSEIDRLKQGILDHSIQIPKEYTGPEFQI